MDGKHVDCTKRKTVKAYVLGVKVCWTQVTLCLISVDPVCIQVRDTSLLIFLTLLVKQF